MIRRVRRGKSPGTAKIRKGVGVYDEEELAARDAFERDFVTALRRHPEHGDTALYAHLASR